MLARVTPHPPPRTTPPLPRARVFDVSVRARARAYLYERARTHTCRGAWGLRACACPHPTHIPNPPARTCTRVRAFPSPPATAPARTRVCGREGVSRLPPPPPLLSPARSRACLLGWECVHPFARACARACACHRGVCAAPPPLLPARVYLNVWMVYLRSVSPIQFLLVGGDKIGNVPAHYLVHSVQVS